MKNLIIASATAALLAVSGFTALPVNPDATPEARKVLDYLEDVRDHNKILSGQESPFDMQYARHIKEVTGKWPAIIGLDFYCEDTVSLRPGMIATAIEYWRAGGLVTICWHETSPKEMEPDAGGWESVRSSMSQKDFNEVVTPGTLLFDRWAANVDIIAAFLQELRDSGVVVLWRPYHEMNGSWFWWGGKEPSSFKKLWYNMYDRLTNCRGLDNLLWVWSPNTDVNAAYYQPELVDVGGVDHYTSIQEDDRWVAQDASLASFMGGKPYSITECGLTPDPECLQAATGYAWFLVWAFGWCDNTAFGMPPANGPGNTPDQLRGLYNHPVCITRDEVFEDLDILTEQTFLTAPHNDLPNPFVTVGDMYGVNIFKSGEKLVPGTMEVLISVKTGSSSNAGWYYIGILAYIPDRGKPVRTKKQINIHA